MKPELKHLLPGSLQKIADYAEKIDPNSKDIALTSAIVTLGCLTPTVKFFDNSKKKATCDLFVAIVMPAGTGKSIASISYQLLGEIHEKAMDRYQELLEMATDKSSKPKPMSVILPSNITLARLIEHFEGQGVSLPLILIENEIDSLFTSLKSNYGGFKSDLRKAFHHEPISSSKKANDELVFIPFPRLSVLVTGTLEQSRRLFTPLEDGFFSRFLIFYSDTLPEWRDYRVWVDDSFLNLDHLALDYYNFYANRDVILDLSPGYPLLNDFGKDQFSKIHSGREDGADLVTRHGLMFLKVLGIMTCIKAYEEKNYSQVLKADKGSISTAYNIVNEHLEMARDLHSLLNTNKNDNIADIKELPEKFTLKEAMKSPGWERISRRSVQRRLQRLVQKGSLERDGHLYVKPML
jgi:hypothetical protein